MSLESQSPEPSLSMEAQERVAEVLIHFSRALKNGENPRIEEYLEGFEGAERAELLRELLISEIQHLGQGGELVSFQEYRARFPEDQDVLAEAELEFRQERTRVDEREQFPAPPQRLRYIGEYELLEEIAHGGMGVVYKARQTSLKRVVALKMILAGHLARPEDIVRFQQEARMAARLKHPHIVPVHEVGEFEGHHYFTMDLVEGRSLAEELREETLAARKTAQIVQSLAQAVHYAHENNILHRDLKPANVILDARDQPHITDFGLAKITERETDETGEQLTATGQVLGTASYMSPEQASGKHNLVGPASDIYSLGAVLYACLTGRGPHLGDSAYETLQQVIDHEPLSPRLLNPGVPKDLETICFKCLRKEPHKRYGTADELAEDLARFIEGKPVKARPVGRITRICRLAKRNRGVAASLSLFIIALISGTTVSTYFALEADARATEANEAKTKALKAKAAAEASAREARNSKRRADNEAMAAKLERKWALWQTYKSRLQPMREAWEEKEFGQLQRLLDESVPAKHESDFRGWEWYFFQDEVNRRFRRIKPKSAKFIYAEWSADGKYLALRRDDGAIEIRDSTNFGVVQILKGDKFEKLAWHPSKHLLAACANESRVEIWDAISGAKLPTLSAPNVINAWGFNRGLAWSHDGTQLALGGYNRIDVWANDGTHLKTLKSVQTRVRDLDWHPDGIRLGAGGTSVVAAVNVNKDKAIWTQHHHRVPVFDVEWDPSGKRLAASWGWPARRIRIYDQTGDSTELPQISAIISSLSWGATSNAIISSDNNANIHHWGLESNSLVRQSRYDASGILSCDFCVKTGQLVSVAASGDATIAHGEKQPDFVFQKQLYENAGEILWSASEDIIACLNSNKIIFVDIHESEVIRTVDAAKGQVFDAMDWHPQRPWLAIQDRRGCIIVIDVRTGRRLFDEKGSSWDFNWSIKWSPNGKYLAAGSGQTLYPGQRGCVDIWDFRSGKKVASLGTMRPRTQVSWSSDSRCIAIGAFSDKQLEFWNIGEREPFAKIRIGFTTWRIAFNSNSRMVAVATTKGPVLVLDVKTESVHHELIGNFRKLITMSWSPDGRRLLGTTGLGILHLWDSATGDKLLTIGKEDDIGNLACWSPDGQRIVTCSHDGNLQILGTAKLTLPKEIASVEDNWKSAGSGLAPQTDD